MLGKLVFNTLVGCFLVLAIWGRDAPQGLSAEGTGPEVAMAATDPTGLADPVKLVPATPAAAAGPASITPLVIQARMPGPALRPSPEHRAAPAPVEMAGGQLWEVAANRLNVRAGPSTGQGVVDQVTRGEQVLVVSDSGSDWVRIRIEGDGVEGWVARRLLRPVR